MAIVNFNNNAPTMIQQSLVLYLDPSNKRSYPGTGTIWYDISGNDNDVTTINGPIFNPDYVSFDGVNDYGWVKNLNYGGGVTISEMSVFAWIRTTFNTGTPGVWGNLNWSLLDFDRSEVFTFAINDTGEVQMSGASTNTGGIGTSSLYDIVGNTRYNDGNWHQIGWTFSVANQKIIMYGDGQIDREFTANGSMTALGSGVQRYGVVGDGSESSSGGGSTNTIYYEGDIGMLFFYDALVLTPAQVSENFNTYRGRYGV